MLIPEDNRQRFELSNESHARTPEPLSTPASVSYLVLFPNAQDTERDLAPVRVLAQRFGVTEPPAGINHYSADFGPFRLKWERHTEFTRYFFIAPGPDADADPFGQPATARLPTAWLAELPGKTLVAVQIVLRKDAMFKNGQAVTDLDDLSNRLFSGNVLVGATIGGGLGTAVTDFRIGPDGFTRILVEDRGMTSKQAGRMVQRLLEIETYRMMSLLALPVARGLTPFLSSCQAELARTMEAMAHAKEDDEPGLLDRLIRLEADIEARHSDNQYRFSAASAYYDIVRRRIGELREGRIEGLQSFLEFTDRRLAPAMQTCQAVAARQEALSRRLARANQLLATRVDLTRERQNQELLESMNRRAKLQLRLQETVEGLSIAAVTYYVVGLIGYAAKAVRAAGVKLDPDLVVGASLPAVVILIAFGVRQIRKAVTPSWRPWRFR